MMMMMMIILMILGRPIHAVRYVHLTINRQRRGLFIRLVKNRVRINHLFHLLLIIFLISVLFNLTNMLLTYGGGKAG